MKSGETFRGLLSQSEPSMNMLLTAVTCTRSTGLTQSLDSVYLRGSGVRLVVVPEMLRQAPCLGKRKR